MKIINSVVGLWSVLAVSVSAHAGNEMGNSADRPVAFLKSNAVEESFELPVNPAGFSDQVRKMVQGNEIIDFDSAANRFRPMEVAGQLALIEKGNAITEFAEPESLDIRVSVETAAQQLSKQPRF